MHYDSTRPDSHLDKSMRKAIHYVVALAVLALLGWVSLTRVARDTATRGGLLSSTTGSNQAPGWTVVKSTVTRGCLSVIPDRVSVQSQGARVLLLYEGQPESAYLVLTSCGVGAGRHHTIYVNGQPATQVADDAYKTCICYGAQRAVTYTLSSPGGVLSGWNHISITNDADVTDTWIAYGGQLLVEGHLVGATKREFTFTSSYDESARRAAYQLPAGYEPGSPAALLVSIGGTGEDRWDALYHYAEEVNGHGWLLLAPDVRQVHKEWGGRTASLATQRDIVDAINYMKEHFAVDEGRIYISGYSTGGGVAATVAAKYPDLFAAAVNWAGPTDLVAWVQQRPELQTGLTALDLGCGPEDGSGPCTFEWQRRSASEMVANLKHVPMALVHGRSDDRVPVAQSEALHWRMQELYDPLAHNKVVVWHDGGHCDAVPELQPIQFMSGFRLNANPPDLMIRTDESKRYYWVHLSQEPWQGRNADGFSNIMASYDLSTGVISATVWDERVLDGGNLPMEITFDLVSMGFNPEGGYAVEDCNLATGTVNLRVVRPVESHLTIEVPRDRHGKAHHRYWIQPFSRSGPRPRFPLATEPGH